MTFNSGIPPIEKCGFGEVIRDIFQHVLFMNFFKDGDGGVSPVGLSNMVKPRVVIPLVAHLVKQQSPESRHQRHRNLV